MHKFKINIERKKSLRQTADKNYKEVTSTTLGISDSDDPCSDISDTLEFMEDYQSDI